MRLVLTQYDSQWVELTGLGGKLLVSVRYGIKLNLRRFDQKTQHWLIHWSQLTMVVQLARSYGIELDYSTLPGVWQLKAAGAPMDVPAPVSPPENPFEKLYVTEDAPIEVIQAAYRALAKLNHPDAGGTTEKFQQIDSAYRRILTLRGCG